MIRAHSDAVVLVHVVFATVNRLRLLPPRMDTWLHAALREQARRANARLLGVGNGDDHVHVVASLHPATALADVVRHLKGATTRMWNLEHPWRRLRWQHGYWARSVEPDTLVRLLPYLCDQRQRHASRTIYAAFEQSAATERTGDERNL